VYLSKISMGVGHGVSTSVLAVQQFNQADHPPGMRPSRISSLTFLPEPVKHLVVMPCWLLCTHDGQVWIFQWSLRPYHVNVHGIPIRADVGSQKGRRTCLSFGTSRFEDRFDQC
jgi:hypothetical protein